MGIGLFVLLGKDPVRGLQMFFWEPLKSAYALGELMVKATPLLIIALGLAVAYRSNVWNIGAEGQFVIGAVAASGVALLADKETGRWIVVAVVLAGMMGGMFWAGFGGMAQRSIPCQRNFGQLDVGLCGRHGSRLFGLRPLERPCGLQLSSIQSI
jgi:ABC-type uncharacterized transport system permease subunit